MRVAALNELRCNLELALPGAIGLFSRPDSPITLTFLRRFPTAAKVAWLSPARFAGWLRSVGYTGGIPADVLYARLTDAAPGLDGAEGEARGSDHVGVGRHRRDDQRPHRRDRGTDRRGVRQPP